MKREDLEKALGGMEDSFIESANQRRSNKERPVFWPVAAAAAVLLLSVVGISIYGKNAAEKNRNETLDGDVRTIEETTAVWEETVAEPQYDGPNFLRMPITDGNFSWNMTRKEVLEELVRLVGIEDSVTAESFESEEEYIQAMEKTFIDKGLLEAEKEDVIGDEMQLEFNWPLETSFGTSSTTRFEFIDYSVLDEDFVPDMPRGQRLTKIAVRLNEKSVTGQQMLDELTDFYDESDPATKIYDPLAGLLSSSFNFNEEYTPTTLYEAIKYENWKVGNLPEERKKIYYELFELNRERMIRQGIDRGMTKEMAEAMAETECDQMYNDDRVMLYLTLMGTNFEEPNPIAITFEMDWLYYLANCIEESRSTSDEVGIEEPIPNFLRMPITDGNFAWNMTRKEVLEELCKIVGIEEPAQGESFENEEAYEQELERMLCSEQALKSESEDVVGSEGTLDFMMPLETAFGTSARTTFNFTDFDDFDRDLFPDAPQGQHLTAVYVVLMEEQVTGEQMVSKLTGFYNETEPVTSVSNPLAELLANSEGSTADVPTQYVESVRYQNWMVGNLSEERKKTYYEVYDLNYERLIRRYIRDHGMTREQATEWLTSRDMAFNDERLMLYINLLGTNFDTPNPVAIRFELDPLYYLANCIEESRNTSDEVGIEEPIPNFLRMPITDGNFAWNMTRKEVLEELCKIVGIEEQAQADSYENDEEYEQELERMLRAVGALDEVPSDSAAADRMLIFVRSVQTALGESTQMSFYFTDYASYEEAGLAGVPKVQMLTGLDIQIPNTSHEWMVRAVGEFYGENTVRSELQYPFVEGVTLDRPLTDRDRHYFTAQLYYDDMTIKALPEHKKANMHTVFGLLYDQYKVLVQSSGGDNYWETHDDDFQLLGIILQGSDLDKEYPMTISLQLTPCYLMADYVEETTEHHKEESHHH